MAEPAVTFLLESMAGNLKRYAAIENDLVRMENDLRLLQGFVEDVGVERLRELNLERQIKEVVLEAQGLRESWLTRRAAKKLISPLNLLLLSQQPDEIRSLRDDRIDPMFRRIEAYEDLGQVQKHTTLLTTQVLSVQLNKEDPPMGANKIVGFEDEAKTLINYLIEETEELDVISITGMPGMGKTTLAWKIYQNEIIGMKFPARIWVDVPLDFSSKDLCLSILKEFMKQGLICYEELVMWLDMPQASCSKDSYLDILNGFTESGRINDHQLMFAVHASLEKNIFLLIMDGVWSAETLESIRYFLPNTGKVLMTSRNNHVTGKSHVLRFLNEDESWELLELEVFGKLGECPETLKSKGKAIAKNCDGSPLAILAVGSSLMLPSSTDAGRDLTDKWWEMVSENVTMYITESGAQKDVFERVELSYTRLPPYLQKCFLYLGVFPEGHEISVWTLTRLWIAEDLIQDYLGLTLEETAEQNLYDLVNKNLVVVGKVYPNGQIKTCRLHKVMYGFCKYKAGEQEFYQEIKMSKGGNLDGPMPLTPNHLRLCIHSCLSEFLSSKPKGPGVRSILCFDKVDKALHSKYSSYIDKSFKLLKILECRYIKFVKFPKELSQLMNLKYISISCDDLDVIPGTISSLCYLETLIIHTRSPSFVLKANIWRMIRMQHLVTKAAIILATRGTGEGGKNLQTLTRLAPECCTEDVFNRAPNVKMLGIRGSLAALSSSEFLRKLEFLEHLKLMNESASNSQLNQLLQPDCFPPNLKRLTLSATYLELKCMSLLGNIHSLEILKLKNNAFIGSSWNTDADGFLRLGFLSIDTMDLISWEASPDCFPSLKCLMLKNCEKLEKIPSSLGKSLDELDVENIAESAVESAREIAEEHKGRSHEFKLSIRE